MLLSLTSLLLLMHTAAGRANGKTEQQPAPYGHASMKQSERAERMVRADRQGKADGPEKHIDGDQEDKANNRLLHKQRGTSEREQNQTEDNLAAGRSSSEPSEPAHSMTDATACSR